MHKIQIPKYAKELRSYFPYSWKDWQQPLLLVCFLYKEQSFEQILMKLFQNQSHQKM